MIEWGRGGSPAFLQSEPGIAGVVLHQDTSNARRRLPSLTDGAMHPRSQRNTLSHNSSHQYFRAPSADQGRKECPHGTTNVERHTKATQTHQTMQKYQ